MKLLFIALFLYSTSAFAEKKDKVCCLIKKEEPKPQVIYKTKWKTKIVEKKVPVKEPCCDKKANRTYQKARTGNQKVIVNVPRQRDRVIIKYKTKVKVKRKRVEVEVTNPNRLQFLVGRSKTKQEVIQEGCCDIKATRKHELDLGLQYTRDFGVFSGSVTGTTNGSYYLGAGFNW